MAYFFIFNPMNTEAVVLVMNSTIIKILLFLLGGIFPFYFAYFVNPLFSTMHTHCLSNRKREKRRRKGPAFVLKEQRKRKTKKQEVFQGEIKTAFVFIQ